MCSESIPAPTATNTCAIVVTYNPDAEFRQRILHVSSQFPLVFIVDNGSNDSVRSMLKVLAADPKIKLTANSTNRGIAEALNQGMKLGLESEFEWAVTLDQDTVVFPDLLETLLGVHATCSGEKVLIGGNYLNINKGRHFVDGTDADNGFLERKTLITAGTLVPLQASTHMGGFRDDYFIDSVDHEFCLRARAHGFRILISRKPVMSQHIGTKMEVAAWWSKFASFNHSPVRKYYIARNTLVTARDYLFREPAWSLRQVWRLLSDFASIILFESNKHRKSSAFVAGLWDGIINKMGPLNENRIKFWK
ncbi:MAG: glycosyltransferase family 2 protein [Arenimonas sp.]